MTQSVWRSLLFVPVLCAAPSPALAADYLTVPEAQRALVPKADRFLPHAVTLTREQLGRIRKLSGVPQRAARPTVWKAMAGARQLGWVIVDEVIGKHEFITYAAAISPDGQVMGVEILSYRETKGGQVRNPRWLGLFRGKTVEDEFRLNRDIPNISGATLSCRNITDGVKRLLAIHRVALAGAG